MSGNHEKLKKQIMDLWLVNEYATDEAYSDALKFIETLPEEMVSLPTNMVAEDGDVMFIWGYWDDKTHLYIDLGFFGDGTYSFYAEDEQNNKMYGDAIPADFLVSGLDNVLRCGIIKTSDD